MAYEFLDVMYGNTVKLNSIKLRLLEFEQSANKSQLAYSKLINDLKILSGLKDE